MIKGESLRKVIMSQLLCLIELTAHLNCINDSKLLSYRIPCVKQNGGVRCDIPAIQIEDE
jgi:hypothetical protein